jgi:hypothetical protein
MNAVGNDNQTVVMLVEALAPAWPTPRHQNYWEENEATQPGSLTRTSDAKFDA